MPGLGDLGRRVRGWFRRAPAASPQDGEMHEEAGGANGAQRSPASDGATPGGDGPPGEESGATQPPSLPEVGRDGLTESQTEARLMFLDLFESNGYEASTVLAMPDDLFSDLLNRFLDGKPSPRRAPPAAIWGESPPPPPRAEGASGTNWQGWQLPVLGQGWGVGGGRPGSVFGGLTCGTGEGGAGQLVIPLEWLHQHFPPVVPGRDSCGVDRDRQDAEFAALEKSASEELLREARARAAKPPPRVPTAELVPQLDPEPESGVTVATRVGARRAQRVFLPSVKGEQVYVWVASEGQMRRDSFELGISGSPNVLKRDETLEEQGVTGRVLVNVVK